MKDKYLKIIIHLVVKFMKTIIQDVFIIYIWIEKSWKTMKYHEIIKLIIFEQLLLL
jgi:hypothetical protein